MEIQEILDAFQFNDGTYKREHVDAAAKLKGEITPHLIGILDTVLSDPEPYIEDEDRLDHVYAVILLGHFEESRAHDVIVDILSIPGNISYQLFGDLVTENFPAILFQTCGGSLARLRSLALNKDAYDFCRGSALQAMVYAVVDGMVAREEVLSFFRSLFTGTEAEEDSAFWSLLANCVYELYPAELMPMIEKAYQDDLIDSLDIRLEDFEDALQYGKEHAFERVRRDMQRGVHTDVHDYMSWWHCFKSGGQVSEAPASTTASSATSATALLKTSTRGKKKRKKKKKTAKASRRKNRR